MKCWNAKHASQHRHDVTPRSTSEISLTSRDPTLNDLIMATTPVVASMGRKTASSQRACAACSRQPFATEYRWSCCIGPLCQGGPIVPVACRFITHVASQPVSVRLLQRSPEDSTSKQCRQVCPPAVTSTQAAIVCSYGARWQQRQGEDDNVQHARRVQQQVSVQFLVQYSVLVRSTLHRLAVSALCGNLGAILFPTCQAERPGSHSIFHQELDSSFWPPNLPTWAQRSTISARHTAPSSAASEAMVP